jgi:hypothetical protein
MLVSFPTDDVIALATLTMSDANPLYPIANAQTDEPDLAEGTEPETTITIDFPVTRRTGGVVCRLLECHQRRVPQRRRPG